MWLFYMTLGIGVIALGLSIWALVAFYTKDDVGTSSNVEDTSDKYFEKEEATVDIKTPSKDNIEFTFDDEVRQRLTSSGAIEAKSGHVFIDAPLSGVFLDDADEMDFSVDGEKILHSSSSAATLKKPLKIINGTATAPSIHFTTDDNLGLFRVGENILGVATGGVTKYEFKIDSLKTDNIILAGIGSAGSPTYSFHPDTNIGMYRVDENKLGFSTAGINRFTIDTIGPVSESFTLTEAAEIPSHTGRNGELRYFDSQLYVYDTNTAAWKTVALT